MHSESSQDDARASNPLLKRLALGVLMLAALIALLPGPGRLISMSAGSAPPGTAVPPPPQAYAGLTVPELAARAYGGGALEVVETMEQAAGFTRYLVRYPSDDLTIYGFMNVPDAPGPLPVIVAVHGYVNPANYRTLDYTTRYADALARAGYLVLHPNLRGYRPSDDGPNPFRVGMALDVLNLIALVRQQGGQPGPLEKADPGGVGLWGHSMGGGISIRAMTVSPDVRAVVLYGSMNGDEARNLQRMREWNAGGGGPEIPADVLARVSPITYLERVQAEVSIHHGAADDTVPPEWSVDLCARLQAAGKRVECFSYDGQPHTFNGAGDDLFMQRAADFFDRVLRGEE